MKRFKLNFIESLFLIIALIVVTFTSTYAFFAAVITSNETSANISGNAADISLTFADANDNGTIVAEKILPGWKDVKEFTITGLNKNKTRNLYYDVVMVVLENDFILGELKYTLAGSGTGSVSVTSSDIPNNPTGGKFNLSTEKAYFPVESDNVVHSYTLTVEYIETDYPQYLDNNVFSAYITVESGTYMSRDEEYNVG